MHSVNCTTCNKTYDVNNSHWAIAQKRKSKFYCSTLCKCKTIEERFWEKVNKTNNIEDCWEWTASGRGTFGYGSIKFKDKHIDAHRLSWMMANNNYSLTIKDFICHNCDNPKCVNPNHLFLGNAQLNAQDAYNKGRLNVPEGIRYKKGDDPLNKVISDHTMKDIKIEIDKKEKSIIKICKDFNVSYQAVRDMRRTKPRCYQNI